MTIHFFTDLTYNSLIKRTSVVKSADLTVGGKIRNSPE